MNFTHLMKVNVLAGILLMIFALHSICSGEKITINFEFSPTDLEFTKSEQFEIVTFKDSIFSSDKSGAPKLPAKFINVLIPPDATFKGIETIGNEIIVKRQTLIYPIQPSFKLTDTPPDFVEPDSSIYNSQKKIPADLAENCGLQIMRGNKMIALRINPVRYVPQRRELYLVTNLQITVTYEYPTTKRTSQPITFRRSNKIFDKMLEEMVINPEELDLLDIKESENSFRAQKFKGNSLTTDYLIITSSQLTNSFQKLADHSIAKRGLQSLVLSLDYVTNSFQGLDVQDKIRECIRYYVYSNNLTYVVLGGDNTVIPDRNCSIIDCPNMPTDLYYSGLDGTWDDVNTNGIYGEFGIHGVVGNNEYDLTPDVIVGRIPVRANSDALKYIDTVIDFENNPPPNSYFRKMLFTGTKLWDEYSGNDRPSNALNDGHSGFREHNPVSDTEMWSRRMFCDIIQP